MIRAAEENDLESIARIWLRGNIEAHCFISEEYWTGNYEMVKGALAQAEVYVYENDATQQVDGFVGLSNNHVEGLFVRGDVRSHGIGKQLLDHAKSIKPNLSLCVYQKNVRAIRFYERELFSIQSEGIDENTNEREYTMAWSGPNA